MAERAYGAAHQRIRIKLLNQLAHDRTNGIERHCPRCGDPLIPGTPLDLGHSTPEAKRQGLPGDRLEHTSCGRSAKDKPWLTQPVGVTPSRDW